MSDTNVVTTAEVAVLGCGNMGSALARTLAGAGHSVVVWNRTHSKAEALASESDNIVAVDTVADAAGAAPVVIMVVALYDDAIDVLAQFGEARPEVVLNLTTGGPPDAIRAHEYCSDRGLNYLDGVLVCYPQNVGKKETVLLISGEEAAWQRASGLVLDLGGASKHVGSDIGAANVIDTGVVGTYYMAALGAFFEALAYMLDEGASPEGILVALSATLPQLDAELEEAVHAAMAKSYPTDQVTLDVVTYGIRGFADTVIKSGHSASHLEATLRLCDSAEENNQGHLAFYSLVEQLRKN